MMVKTAKDARPKPFSVRLEPELREKLQALADADERTLTRYVLRVLRAHVDGDKKG